MKKYQFTFVALSVVALFATAVSAQTVFVFQEGLNGYEGTSDTSYWPDDPLDIAGDNTTFEWDTSSLAYGLIHFDDVIGSGSGQVPPDSTLISAILTLTCSGSGSETEIATLHNLLKPFNEDEDFLAFTMNYDMVPGDDYAEDVIAEIPGPSSGDNIDLDVTSSVAAWLEGEPNYGWIVVPGGSDGVDIQSSEASGSTIPTLTVDTPIGVFTFQDGLDGYDGTMDTWLNTGNGVADVFGENTRFEWDGDDNGGSNFGLLRFDNIIGTGSGQIPPGTTINSAMISLSIVDGGDTAELHEILPGEGDESTDFDNSTTTMLDWGDGFEPIYGVHFAEDIVAEVPGDTGNVEVDVTSTIAGYASGDKPNTGWIFYPTGGGGVEVVASEGASGDSGPPKLTITIEGEVDVQHFSIY